MEPARPHTGERANKSYSRSPSAVAFDRIVLTGFMGSGKTTVGRLLADRLDWRFIDLDDEVVRAGGSTIAQLFADRGEPAFRSLETAALEASLRTPRIVLALGGGAVETAANRTLLTTLDRTLTILLAAPFPTLFDRCVAQTSDPSAAVRPLLSDRDAAAQRHDRRVRLYESIASLTVDTSRQTPAETLEHLLRALGSTL
jgi:shikimate kinase